MVKKIFTIILISISVILLARHYSRASGIAHISDTISTSWPSATSSHTFLFITNVNIPASGRIAITPEAGNFNIPAGFNFNDVDIATSSSLTGAFIDRAVAATAAAQADGVSVVTGVNGSITITLNSSYGIDSGTAIKIDLGINADFGASGDTNIYNPDAIGSYRIKVEIFDGLNNLLSFSNYPLIAIVLPVTMTGDKPRSRFNGAPSGNLDAGTTQTIMSLETNYYATCRYETASNTPYALMTGLFTNTGQTFHSITLTGLTAGDYNFYVKCVNLALEPDLTDYLIAFSINTGESDEPGDEGDEDGTGSGGSGGGGAGGGSGGGIGQDEGPGTGDYLPYPPPPGSPGVVLKGWGYPLRDVHILKDGVEIGKASANTLAEFAAFYSIENQGVYSFGVWSDDSIGRKSVTISSTFFLEEGTQTTVSDIIIPPTIELNKNVIDPGETIRIFGQSVPSTTIEVWLYPDTAGQPNDEEINKLTRVTSNIGQWEIFFSTGSLTELLYQVKARVKLSGLLQSDFGSILKLSLGEALPEEGRCSGSDLNGDGRVNITDFSILLYWWGSDDDCADQNDDGNVDLIDFSIMMFNWTG